MSEQATNLPTASAADSGPVLAPAELQDFVRFLGQLLNAASLYGPGHKMAQQALDESFRRLTGFFQTHESLVFSMIDGSLLLEDCTIDTRNGMAATFVRRLGAQSIESFVVDKSVTREELGALMEIIGTPPDKLRAEGGFAGALSKRGIVSIRASAASFQKVSESDLVLKKDDLMQQLATAAAGAAPDKPQTIEQIVAFLKGDAPGSSGDGGKGGGKDASSPEADADKLADMILKSADIRPDAATVDGGESLIDLVVGSLRRQAQQLLDSPAVRTQQGRKNISKTLLLLEKNILDKLRAMAGAALDVEPVEEAFEDMRNDLAIDALATEYMKKRTAVEGAEEKILKHMRRSAGRGGDAEAALQERLLEEGLTPEGWQQLQIRSGAAAEAKHPSAAAPAPGLGGTGPGPGGGIGLEGVQMLAMLLTQLDSMLDPAAASGGGELAAEVVKDIDAHVDRVVEQTERQLEEFAGVIQSMAGAAETSEPQRQRDLSRKRLLEILAEVIQELCQPLSVINCTIEMVATKRLGELNVDQEEMLKLSASSGERLKHLVEKLREICGNPESRSPDAGILDMVYSR